MLEVVPFKVLATEGRSPFDITLLKETQSLMALMRSQGVNQPQIEAVQL
jgi:hypothetical protein